MKKALTTIIIAAAFLLVAALPARAADFSSLLFGGIAQKNASRAAASRSANDCFSLNGPTYFSPPTISDITNSSAVARMESFTVSAKITGSSITISCCDAACEQTDCAMVDWYFKSDSDYSPNPACIPNENGEKDMPDASCKKSDIQNPLVYYYLEDDIDNTLSVPMKYDFSTDKFTADIPIDPSWTSGDKIKYYIAAADSMGSVAAMLPQKNAASCISDTSWSAKYETPKTDNCAAANNSVVCEKAAGTAPVCNSDHTINDAEGDTCGEHDSCTPGTTALNENVDILGVSAGFGKGYTSLPNDDVICARMTLKGTFPSSSGPIEGYEIIFLNPDINDSNPADIYYPNVFAITYTPEEIAEDDANLVKTLWDGECWSNPNTSDILSCKIVTGTDPKLAINFNNHDLTFIAKNAVTTNKGDKTIVGSTSGSVTIQAITGEMNISGGTAYWTVDQTQPLMLINDTREVTLENGSSICSPAPCLKIDGNGADGEFRAYSFADPQCSNPSDCLKSPITPAYSNITDGTLELVDETAPDTVLASVTLSSDGTAPVLSAPTGSPGHLYDIRLRLPAASYNTACSKTTADYCYLIVKSEISLPSSQYTLHYSIKSDVPAGSSSGGGDIGNPNCDTAVNLQDILAIKNTYGTSSGDTCYRAWADFNNDGFVNLTDITFMKKYYGRTVSSSAPTNAVLCASKAPLPFCCATKTCP